MEEKIIDVNESLAVSGASLLADGGNVDGKKEIFEEKNELPEMIPRTGPQLILSVKCNRFECINSSACNQLDVGNWSKIKQHQNGLSPPCRY